MSPSDETSASSSRSDKPCHFFKLPPELRLDIYDSVFNTTYLRGIDIEADRRRLSPAFLYTCSDIHDESRATYTAQLNTVIKHALGDIKLCNDILQVMTDYLAVALDTRTVIDLAEIRKFEAHNKLRHQASESVVQMTTDMAGKVLGFQKVRLAAVEMETEASCSS
ncbi:hypothetical protein DOTSEDRAFT_24645 [Dothistroma septosporum NZE10]|uniref:F-box domain-containing protein n=1 Tax=Dothistroma septosporum (strain NZE10 / CBS 128990) TaxID=675120 RepID=N1PQE7_DOTSN|nr:hypothetical protein DOTSEDRAFT_24645 [Dothistroma septosporum NZE10]